MAGGWQRRGVALGSCTVDTMIIVAVAASWLMLLTPLTLVACTLGIAARNDGDQESWWMSGRRESMFFFRVYKGSHNDTRLGKVAGDMLEDS